MSATINLQRSEGPGHFERRKVGVYSPHHDTAIEAIVETVAVTGVVWDRAHIRYDGGEAERYRRDGDTWVLVPEPPRAEPPTTYTIQDDTATALRAYEHDATVQARICIAEERALGPVLTTTPLIKHIERARDELASYLDSADDDHSEVES